MAHDVDTIYLVFSNFGDDGYDFHIASHIGAKSRELFEDDMGSEIAGRFERVNIPEATYLVCETERCKWPGNDLEALYRKAVTHWLPSSGYELAGGPEVEVIHWFYREDDEALNISRYAELWLPITKKRG